MSTLLAVVENEMTISHRVVAENTANQEKSIRNIINKYIDDFKTFGAVHFKNATREDGNTGGNQPITFFLNEQQAYLLFTYLRNNEIVRSFKVALIKAFFEMRKELYHIASKSFQGKSIIHTINGLKGGLAVKDRKISQLENRLTFVLSENEKLKVHAIRKNDYGLLNMEDINKQTYSKDDIVTLLSKGLKYDFLLKDFYAVREKYDSIVDKARVLYPNLQSLTSNIGRALQS